jgi:hypothetical protein
MVDEQKSPGDPYSKQLEDEESTAWDVAIDAILKYSAARAQVAHYQGFKAGREYERGKMLEAFEQASKPTNALATPSTSPPARTTVPDRASSDVNQRTAAEIVMGAIKVHPGLTGVELLAKIHESGTPLKERTFRTALFRMKVPAAAMPQPGHIMAVNNRWYRVEDAPVEAVEQLRRTRAELIGMLSAPKENGGQ